ncbi:uncharacterized protein LOC143291891 [Babylonia areolata]|uniref:uncharacterized protein LOC143291891 n=1 Tax=Babylonia areolata TaxID=304850 RepID=UPI003FD5A3F3
MKRSDMEAQMKSRSRGGVPKSVGRPIGVLPIETRKPLPPRLPLSSSTGARRVPSSRASSTTSYRSLASSRSTRDKTERPLPVPDLELDDATATVASDQDIHFIDGPGNSSTSASASARSALQSARPQETKTITPAEILELCQEENFYKVYEVDLHGAEITVIPDLEKFRKLRVLDLSGNHICKLQHLDFNQDLRDLKLYDNKISKLEGLGSLKELCNLQLQHNQIESLGKGLSGQKKLKCLRLDSNRLSKLDTSELVSCVSLTSLDLSNNRLTNLSAISYLPNLEELFAAGNGLQKLTDLHRCKKLTEIDLSRNRLSDLSAISGLPALQILDVSDNQLKSVTSLGKLKSLEDLNLSGNQLSDLSGWGTSFPKLQILNLCDNMVTTWKQVCCLKEVPELVEVSLAGNPVTLEGGECPAHHTYLMTMLPDLEVIDGAHVKRSSGKGGAAPVMRPMSAASVLSVKQIDMQLKTSVSEQESLHKSIADRFASLKTVFDSLPVKPPSSVAGAGAVSSSSSSSQAAPPSPLPPDSFPSPAPSPSVPTAAAPQSSRCSRRNRIRAAQAFAATVPDEDNDG